MNTPERVYSYSINPKVRQNGLNSNTFNYMVTPSPNSKKLIIVPQNKS